MKTTSLQTLLFSVGLFWASTILGTGMQKLPTKENAALNQIQEIVLPETLPLIVILNQEISHPDILAFFKKVRFFLKDFTEDSLFLIEFRLKRSFSLTNPYVVKFFLTAPFLCMEATIPQHTNPLDPFIVTSFAAIILLQRIAVLCWLFLPTAGHLSHLFETKINKTLATPNTKPQTFPACLQNLVATGLACVLEKYFFTSPAIPKQASWEIISEENISLLKDYLAQDKAIDEEFIEKYIAALNITPL